MKKLFTLLMTLVLVFSISDVALADQGKLSVSGPESVKRGEEIEYTVSLANCDKANTLGIEISYDENVLTKVINDCDWLLEGALESFDPVKNQGVWTVETAKSLNTDVFKLVFTVNGNAPIAKTDVTVKLIVKKDATVVGTFTETLTINVVCDHVYGDWTNKDANNHAKVCKNCQAEALEAHKWDAGKVTQAATATTEGIKTFTCTVCSATTTEAIPATGAQGGTTTPNGETNNQGTTPSTPSTPESEVTTPEDTQVPDVDSTEGVEDTEAVEPETEDEKADDNELPTASDGGNAGAVVGVILVIALIAAVALVLLKKKK